MTFVKICGITNLEDALAAVDAGADALGFNFYRKSPRYVAPDVAREIIGELPDSILSVGVFVNEDFTDLIEIAKMTRIGATQLHGNEEPDYAAEAFLRTGLPVIKAFGVSLDFSIERIVHYDVDSILLDAFAPIEHGGTGKIFDWEIAKAVNTKFPKVYLAGGLSADNVKDAIRLVLPYAVDASSLLESSPGKKDPLKVRAFVAAAKEHE